ncbi:zinc-binding alcohol dehydrogenase [Microbacterium sp. NPDC078428]|uniref:zinc-binding alcohol dehydrogenase n=1 Tax=Microbacterium sp. NPDC078428 TaxID=3364190 RepID=UPI0037C95252
MHSAGKPEWVVREDASVAVILALTLRQLIGIRSPEELPPLRGLATTPVGRRDEATQALLERQWREYWALTVEPQAHPATGPLDLVDGFETYAALPVEGFDELREQMTAHLEALDFARRVHERHSSEPIGRSGVSYRAYAGAIAQHEREVGRRAHSFELNVQVLPLSQRGVWWIGSLTIAVTDGLRSDVVAFDSAIHPIIAEIA